MVQGKSACDAIPIATVGILYSLFYIRVSVVLATRSNGFKKIKINRDWQKKWEFS